MKKLLLLGARFLGLSTPAMAVVGALVLGLSTPAMAVDSVSAPTMGFGTLTRNISVTVTTDTTQTFTLWSTQFQLGPDPSIIRKTVVLSPGKHVITHPCYTTRATITWWGQLGTLTGPRLSVKCR